MHPFSIPWKHQKTLKFYEVFRGQRKGALEKMGQFWNKLANCSDEFTLNFKIVPISWDVTNYAQKCPKDYQEVVFKVMLAEKLFQPLNLKS